MNLRVREVMGADLSVDRLIILASPNRGCVILGNS
jgi:hypothetical protein